MRRHASSKRRSGLVRAERAVVLAAVAASLLAAAGAARAGPVRIGIGDQATETLADSDFAALGISTARIVVPWNIVEADPWRLALWVNAANARGIEPLIALGRSATDRCPAAPCRLPSDSEYRAAFAQLHAVFPSVRLFVAWNEPNHAREPTAGNPAAAARYADIVAEVCPDCAVIAGDVLDAPGMRDYLARYRAALTFKPAAWGLHNYYDTTYFRPTGTETFLAAVDGPVWLTESGGIVTWRTPDGQVQLPYDEQRAAASLGYGLWLAAEHADRIERMYVYQWRAGPADDFDAGLVRADGSARPALAVLRAALTVPTGDAPPPAVLVAPPRRPSAQVVLGRIRLAAGGRVRVRLVCLRGRCRGRLTLEGGGGIAERLVNGRTMRGRLAPQRRAFDLVEGGHVKIHLHVPAAVVRRASRRDAALKVTVVPALAGAFLPVQRALRFPRSLQKRR